MLYDKNFLWKRLQYDTSSTAYKSFNRKVEECGGNTYEKSQGAFISIVTAKSGGNVITEVRNSWKTINKSYHKFSFWNIFVPDSNCINNLSNTKNMIFFFTFQVTEMILLMLLNFYVLSENYKSKTCFSKLLENMRRCFDSKTKIEIIWKYSWTLDFTQYSFFGCQNFF